MKSVSRYIKSTIQIKIDERHVIISCRIFIKDLHVTLIAVKILLSKEPLISYRLAVIILRSSNIPIIILV